MLARFLCQRRAPARIHLGIDRFGIERAGAAQRGALFDEPHRVCQRCLTQIAIDNFVHESEPGGVCCANRTPARDQLERGLDTREPRCSLRTACSRQQPEVDLGEADFRPFHSDAIVSAERDFETAAKRRAVQCRDDELAGCLDLVT